MEIITIPPSLVSNLSIHLIICVILWFLVISAISIDLWDRVYTQRKTGKKIESRKLRMTIEKFSEYWRFLLMAFAIDAVIFIVCVLLEYRAIPIMSILFCCGLLGIEAKSLFEHAKERKSNVTEMNKIISIIVNAASDKDAKEAIKNISDYLDTEKR